MAADRDPAGGAPLHRSKVQRHFFDARGRRVVLGTATITRDGEERELTLWCEPAGINACVWGIAGADLPQVELVEPDPAGTAALVGNAHEVVKVDLETGEIGARTSEPGLVPCTLAADGSVLGVHDGALVRRDAGGSDAPVWPARTGINGWLDRKLARAPKDRLRWDVLPGAESLMGSGRPRRLEDPGRLLAEADGGLSVVGSTTAEGEDDESRQAVGWIRYDRDGNFVHHLVLPRCVYRQDMTLDASGRLWLHVGRVDGKFSVVRIDPHERSARVIAQSEHRRDFVGFAVDPRNELVLCRDEPEGGGSSLAVIVRDDGDRTRRLLTRLSLVGLAVAQLGEAGYALLRRPALADMASRGESLLVPFRGGHSTYDPEALVQLLPGVTAQAGMSVVTALGVLALLPMTRSAPLRALAIALVWFIATGVIALFVYAIVTRSVGGVFDVTDVVSYTWGIQLGCVVACFLLVNRLA